MTETQAFVEISSRSAAELAQKYLALWNEPDADRRRRMIAGLWTEDGRHILQPPEEIRGIAARPGLGMTANLEARGYEEIEARAASAYEHWVGSEGLSFRGRDDADRIGDVVKLHWEAVAQDGTVFAVGLSFLLLAADGPNGPACCPSAGPTWLAGRMPDGADPPSRSATRARAAESALRQSLRC